MYETDDIRISYQISGWLTIVREVPGQKSRRFCPESSLPGRPRRSVFLIQFSFRFSSFQDLRPVPHQWFSTYSAIMPGIALVLCQISGYSAKFTGHTLVPISTVRLGTVEIFCIQSL